MEGLLPERCNAHSAGCAALGGAQGVVTGGRFHHEIASGRKEGMALVEWKEAMRGTDYVRRFRNCIVSQGPAFGRRSEFTCGDCERSDRCGSPPSETCIIRAAQIARGDWKRKRQIGTLAQW